MMSNDFHNKLAELFQKLGNAKKMVLATSQDNKVTARMMSCIIYNDMIYFQTDKKFIKYKQITANPMVALCIDNIQIEGVASFQGHPLETQNKFFAKAYESNFKGSFDSYSALADEVLIEIKPLKITLWEYEGKEPYRLIFDLENQYMTLDKRKAEN